MPQIANKRLLTIPEAAAELSLGRTTIYALLARGELDAVRVGRAVRITPRALEDFIRRLQDDGAA
jgi:excisionase family DNA binding protein